MKIRLAFVALVALTGCNGPSALDPVANPFEFTLPSDETPPAAITREDPLMSLQVERESGTHLFSVALTTDPMTQVETIQGLRVVSSSGSSSIYAPANLPQGVVLQKRSGRNVITISSQDFSLETGGGLNLRYLYAGGAFSDSYRDFQMGMSKNASGKWELTTKNADGTLRPFTKMNMYLNTRAFIGVVGIRQIVTE